MLIPFLVLYHMAVLPSASAFRSEMRGNCEEVYVSQDKDRK
jgi:hypothetical protein